MFVYYEDIQKNASKSLVQRDMSLNEIAYFQREMSLEVRKLGSWVLLPLQGGGWEGDGGMLEI